VEFASRHADQRNRAVAIIARLRHSTQKMQKPAAVALIEKYGKDPFLILISCLLSLRAKDTVSLPISIELFAQARTPEQLLTISEQSLQKMLYSLGFYRQKAALLHAVSAALITRFQGKVPRTENELLSLPGVGRKTANLVLGYAFDIPALCVDVHVHRVSNRLGIVHTKTPYETEKELQAILPQEYWIEYNSLMVMWGQNICVPVSPFCSRCILADICPKKGVTRSR
jgi:endonuclease III